MRFLKKHAYTLLFSTALLSANVYVLLKTFVIPSAVTKVAAETSSTTASTETGEVTTTDTSYQDDNISIHHHYKFNTTYYVNTRLFKNSVNTGHFWDEYYRNHVYFMCHFCH